MEEAVVNEELGEVYANGWLGYQMSLLINGGKKVQRKRK